MTTPINRMLAKYRNAKTDHEREMVLYGTYLEGVNNGIKNYIYEYNKLQKECEQRNLQAISQ